MTPICRIYTEPITDLGTIADVMEACVALRLPFYYSGRQRVVRAESRTPRRIMNFENELRALRVKYTKTFYRK